MSLCWICPSRNAATQAAFGDGELETWQSTDLATLRAAAEHNEFDPHVVVMSYLSNAGFLRVYDCIVVVSSVVADSDGSIARTVSSVEDIDRSSCRNEQRKVQPMKTSKTHPIWLLRLVLLAPLRIPHTHNTSPATKIGRDREQM